MQTKYKVIIAVTAIAVSFATGRWSAPIKTVTVTKTITVEAKKDVKTVDEKQHTETTTTEKINPDGSKVITSVTTTDTGSKSVDKSSDNTTNTSESSKTVERDKSRLTLSILGGVPISLSGSHTLVYGGQVYKEVLGPIGIGAWYLSNNTGGLSIGLSL